MKKIAFVGAKGGVGKTTSAVLTALALCQSGQDVVVVDTDPQQSAKAWEAYAAQVGPPLPMPVISAGADFARYVPAGSDWVIVDTPPGDMRVIEAALAWADLIILPTRPGALDVLQVASTLELAKERGVSAAVLLTQTRAGVRETEETAEAFAEGDVSLMQARIPLRARTARLVLMTPSARDLDASGYTSVATELIEAFQ